MTQIITIDGPAGAGKTTVSKVLAKKLGCTYVDTGALYRAVAYEIINHQIAWEKPKTLDAFLEKLNVEFFNKDASVRLISSGKDITDKIRTPEISMLASKTSALPCVRKALLNIQKEIAKKQDAVFEGRDMGTVVFPQAQVKFFLFADLLVRAQRRFAQMPDSSKDLDTVKKEMQIRDDQDSKRAVSPLKPALDAIHIDASNINVDQVIEKMLDLIQKRMQKI